ncbi:MAG: exodeoxyribonuclease VII small subunit [Gemmatimonadaceae bacterium]
MPTFEQSVARLEAIVEEMERQDVSLDRALGLFEEGIEQLRAAQAELTRAEASVKVLTERADGVLGTADLGA